MVLKPGEKLHWEVNPGDMTQRILLKKAKEQQRKTSEDIKEKFSTASAGQSGSEIFIRKNLLGDDLNRFEKYPKEFHQRILTNIKAGIQPFNNITLPKKVDATMDNVVEEKPILTKSIYQQVLIPFEGFVQKNVNQTTYRKIKKLLLKISGHQQEQEVKAYIIKNIKEGHDALEGLYLTYPDLKNL